MRKILLATTALVGFAFAGAAQAAPTSPISLEVGGYNDFIAGLTHGGSTVVSDLSGNNTASKNTGKDFEDEFKISFDAKGKASNGIEYGANISLWNGSEATTLVPWSGGNAGVTVNSAYVWMSGAFGKILMGDEHGASDLFVYAPTVGEGQIDGRYTDFVSTAKIAPMHASGFDNTEHSTKITYYTPKVGNDANKVQVGLSYAPSLYNYGQSVVGNQTASTATSAINGGASTYQDMFKAVAQYTGNFKPVAVTASAQWIHGGNGHGNLSNTSQGFGLAWENNNGSLGSTANGQARSFNAWGLGTQVAFNGITLGGAYNSLGHYNEVVGQGRSQNNFNLGAKYEFDKVGVALNYLHGKGYNNIATSTADTVVGDNTNYISKFNAVGAGATYTWFPGLTSNVDGVMYKQTTEDANTTSGDQQSKQGGYTLLVSQRLAF